MKWKSINNYLNLLKAVLYVIKNDNLYLNRNLCFIVSEIIPINNLFKVIADPIIINYNDLNSPYELIKLFKWNKNAFNDDLNDIIFTVKIL